MRATWPGSCKQDSDVDVGLVRLCKTGPIQRHAMALLVQVLGSYICIYTYIYIHVHIYIYTYIYVYIYIYINTYIHTYTHTSTHTHTYVYIYVHVRRLTLL